MNLRHAAALALVGCYLMVPPSPQGLTKGIDVNAALSQWTVLQSFDTAAECEKRRAALIDKLVLMPANPTSQAQIDAPPEPFKATCVATDDQRLKGN